MKTGLIVMYLILSFFLYAGETEFVTELSGKEEATFEDLVTSFCYLYGLETGTDFEKNLDLLQEKLSYFPKDLNPGRSATIGDFSLFAMQYLGLESGLFYLATKSGRYASRELMIRLIVPKNSSEHEVLSGLELLRYIRKVVDYEKPN